MSRPTALAVVLVAPAIAGGYVVGVAGIHGGLGRELAQQGVERGWGVRGLSEDATRRVRAPFRRSQLRDGTRYQRRAQLPYLDDARLRLVAERDFGDVDALLLTMSTRPFSEDRSHEVVARLCDALSPRCRFVGLVSAWGVGDSIRSAGPGIRAMRAWYLKDVYASKQRQELAVGALPSDVRRELYRPRVLAYGALPWLPAATTREDLARRMLDDVADALRAVDEA